MQLRQKIMMEGGAIIAPPLLIHLTELFLILEQPNDTKNHGHKDWEQKKSA
jgi:hypothetical protein